MNNILLKIIARIFFFKLLVGLFRMIVRISYKETPCTHEVVTLVFVKVKSCNASLRYFTGMYLKLSEVIS
jgi:hypothetical protein